MITFRFKYLWHYVFFLIQKQLGILVVSTDYDAVGANDVMDSLEYNFFGVSEPRSRTVTMQGSQQKYNTR